jgi:hypothetical protein
MFNEEILRIWSVMILLQEISKRSQDGILLYVTLQHYEPNKYILQEKKVTVLRNWGSKVTSGDTETKTTVSLWELHMSKKCTSLAFKQAHMSFVVYTEQKLWKFLL